MIALPGQSIDYANPINRGLEGFYDFSEMAGIKAVDKSNKGRTGTLTNARFAGSDSGEAMLDLSGTGYATLPGNPFDYTSQDFSVSLTITRRDSSTRSIIGNYVYISSGWGIITLSNGQVAFRTTQLGAIQETSTSTNAIPPYKKVLLQVVRIGSTAFIMVNGVDLTTTHATHINPTATNAPLYIGTYPGSVGNATYGWIGSIGNVRIYSRGPTNCDMQSMSQSNGFVKTHKLFTLQTYMAAKYRQRQQQGMAA